MLSLYLDAKLMKMF